MSKFTSRNRLLSLAVAALSLGGTAACSGAMADDELTLGEGTAYLMAAEESGELASGAEAPDEVEGLRQSANDAAGIPEAPPERAAVCDFAARLERREHALKQYDTNGDKKLDAAERAAMKADLQSRDGAPFLGRMERPTRGFALKRLRFAFDEDHSKSLDEAERTALVDAMNARCERIHAKVLEAFDADKSGGLDETERKAAIAAHRERVAKRRAELLAKYDVKVVDGALDEAERAAMRDALLAKWLAKRAEVIKAHDLNQDGKLDAKELLALKLDLQKAVTDGRDAEE
jgi:hypothetical protein